MTDHSISVPLDSEGFLRRACPTCSRELKWKVGEGERLVDGEASYFCPYCGIRTPANAWWTKAQLAAARSQAISEIVDPQIGGPMNTSGPPSPGFIPIDPGASAAEDPGPLSEPNDMRRVEFRCHSEQPVKVTEEWSKPVHCPLCGELGGEWADGG